MASSLPPPSPTARSFLPPPSPSVQRASSPLPAKNDIYLYPVRDEERITYTPTYAHERFSIAVNGATTTENIEPFPNYLKPLFNGDSTYERHVPFSVTVEGVGPAGDPWCSADRIAKSIRKRMSRRLAELSAGVLPESQNNSAAEEHQTHLAVRIVTVEATHVIGEELEIPTAAPGGEQLIKIELIGLPASKVAEQFYPGALAVFTGYFEAGGAVRVFQATDVIVDGITPSAPVPRSPGFELRMAVFGGPFLRDDHPLSLTRGEFYAKHNGLLFDGSPCIPLDELTPALRDRVSPETMDLVRGSVRAAYNPLVLTMQVVSAIRPDIAILTGPLINPESPYLRSGSLFSRRYLLEAFLRTLVNRGAACTGTIFIITLSPNDVHCDPILPQGSSDCDVLLAEVLRDRAVRDTQMEKKRYQDELADLEEKLKSAPQGSMRAQELQNQVISATQHLEEFGEAHRIESRQQLLRQQFRLAPNPASITVNGHDDQAYRIVVNGTPQLSTVNFLPESKAFGLTPGSRFLSATRAVLTSRCAMPIWPPPIGLSVGTSLLENDLPRPNLLVMPFSGRYSPDICAVGNKESPVLAISPGHVVTPLGDSSRRGQFCLVTVSEDGSTLAHTMQM